MNRTQLEITLGALFILVTSSIILFYGLNEEKRMIAFEESQQGRAKRPARRYSPTSAAAAMAHKARAFPICARR